MRSISLGPNGLEALTGLPSQVVREVARLTAALRTLGRPPKLRRLDRVLLVLIALGTNLTERALAAIFRVSQSTVHRMIAALLPRIAGLFKPAEPEVGATLLLDGTLIPVHDQRLTRPSKNYRRSVNVQVLATAERRVVQVGWAWPGNRNDIVVARATVRLPPGYKTLTDGGYRSLPGATTPPRKRKPQPFALFGDAKGTPDPGDDAALREHRRVRARIEHTIARMKDWQMLCQCRRKGEAINHATTAVAYLLNTRTGAVGVLA